MADDITIEEWQAELERLSAEQPDGMTMRELAEAWGVHYQTAKVRVGVLWRAGRARCSGKRKTLRIDGHSISVPVYQLVRRRSKAR